MNKSISANGTGMQALHAWMTDAIKDQVQLKDPPQNIDALLKALKAAVPEELASQKRNITKALIHEVFEDVFWKGHTDVVRHAVKAKYTPEALHELLERQWKHHIVPLKWIVEAKLQYMKGLSEAPREEDEGSAPGILRAPLMSAPPYSLTETNYEHPFHAFPKARKNHFRVAVISAPQIGLAYEETDIVRNLTRCAISVARKKGCDALVVSGGLFRLTWQKTSGPGRLLHDLVTGTEIDVEAMAKSYRARVMEILEKGDSLDPIFMTALERFRDLLRGWYKVAMRPGKKPEFEGPVYIVLGPDELGLVRRMAYFELLYRQIQELRQAESEMRLHTKLESEAREHLAVSQRGGASKTVLAQATRTRDEAQQQAREAVEKVTRLRMSNLEPTQNRRVYDQALSFLIHEVEKRIPNAKVIDQNRAYVVFGASNQVIKFVSGGDTNNPYIGEISSYGPAQREGRLPALTVVSHPRAVYMRKTSRENYQKGSMLGTVGFVEAPVLVDPGPIRERMRGGHTTLPCIKTVLDPMFSGGMMILNVSPAFGVASEFLSVETVRRMATPAKTKGAISPATRMMWLMVSTDMHFGGSMRVFLRQPSGLPIGLTEAVFGLLQKWGLQNGIAPITGFFACDDVLHGNHFGTHKRSHYGVRPFAQMLRSLEQALQQLPRGNSKSREAQLREMLLATVDQIRSRPPDYLTGQFLELFHGLFRAYPDVFRGILLKAKEARVVVRGASDLAGVASDLRDVGLINFGSGNHATKTTDGMLHEGPIVAEVLRARLWLDPALAGMDLDRLIKAPLYQDQGIGYGTIKAGRGYEWALHVSGTPPKRDSWYDVLHGWVQVNRARGNPSAVLDGKSIVHITGDKHFFAGAFAGKDVYVMGPSSTYTDAFADIAGGLPENNSGVAFIGLPVDGPDAGEISVKHLTPMVIQDYLTSGKPFPWDEFLPGNM